MGKEKTYNLTMKSDQHNYAIFSKKDGKFVISRNSHAYGYSLNAARQLWLKSYYPLEFYTALFRCENDASKIKEYKIDAQKHGIHLQPLHINHSKFDFNIHDDQVYIGFNNLNGVGKVAKQVVDNQPYTSFLDFLARFGTDKKVLDALITLNVFEEKYDKTILYKFYRFYRDFLTKRNGSVSRFEKAIVQRKETLEATLLDHWDKVQHLYSSFEEFKAKCGRYEPDCYIEWEKFKEIVIEEEFKAKGQMKTREITLHKVFDRLRIKDEQSYEKQEKKKEEAETFAFSLDEFNPDKWVLEPEVVELINNVKAAESEYYGFQWKHELEESPDFEGFTVDKFMHECESENLSTYCVELMIKSVNTKTSAKGTTYHSIEAEDSNSKTIRITFWDEDYKRWAEEIVAGNLLRMRLKPPSNGFPSFMFDSPPKHEKWKLPKNKEEDYRICVMKKKQVELN